MQNDNSVCVHDNDCASQIQPPFVALADMSDNEKVWDTHKLQSFGILQHFQQSNEPNQQRYAARIISCSDKLGFIISETNDFKLSSAWFCRVRLCPICQWRRSMMWKAKFYQALPAIIEQAPNGRWLFLTLTVRNCHVNNLRETIKEMNSSWTKLVKRKEFKDVLGWVRTTEITRNETDNTAHPHFHVLLLVKSGYFGGNYVTQSAWTDAWQGALKCDYKPMVNIKAVRKKGKAKATGEKNENYIDGIVAAAVETLKYAVKPADMLANKDWFLEMAKQTFKLRFIASGGLLKNVFKDCEPDTEELNGDKEVDQNCANDLVFDWNTDEKKYMA
jgi:plasmid rolling circle replication initiator protein Rep